MAKSTLTMTSGAIGEQLLDLLFPPRCQVCGDFSADPLCDGCREAVELIDERGCPSCGIMMADTSPENLPGAVCAQCRAGRWLSGVRSVGLHTGTLRRAIIRYKFGGRRQLAATFAAMLADLVHAEIDAAQGPGLPLDLCEALVPVPLHPRRRRWRGFDQAELLCAELARELDVPVWPDGLERVRHTLPQTDCSGPERRRNVRGAFVAPRPWRMEGRSLILVDDVFTTGATLDECAVVLKGAGAAAVYGLTVSRAAPAWYCGLPADRGQPAEA
ncbi:MAG: ComF family protein [Armatimonadota bacterium]